MEINVCRKVKLVLQKAESKIYLGFFLFFSLKQVSVLFNYGFLSSYCLVWCLNKPLMNFWWVHLKKLSPQFGWILIHELKPVWFCSKTIWKWLQCSSFIDITLAFGANPGSLEVYMQTWLTMGLPFISDVLPDLMSMEALYTVYSMLLLSSLAYLQKLNVFLQLHQCLWAKRERHPYVLRLKPSQYFTWKKCMHL